MSFLKIIHSKLNGKSKEAEYKIKPTTAVLTTSKMLQHCSIRCRCGGLAIPTATKGCLYQCVRCDRLFNHIEYNFEHRKSHFSSENSSTTPLPTKQGFDMSCYEEAMQLLKTEDRDPIF